MGIFGQNTGKTITKQEHRTSKRAIYRGNPHFQPFFNHRTRPPQIHQLRTVFTPMHTITHRTRTVLRTHARHLYAVTRLTWLVLVNLRRDLCNY